MITDLNEDFTLPPEVVRKYVTRRFDDVQVCRSALQNNDFIKVAELAHQMKGNGSSFGFPVITQIGGELEIAAKSTDAEKIHANLQKLDQFLNTVKSL